MRGSLTPSIVPNGTDQTVYIVLCDFGPLGQAYFETDPERADLETTITDLLSGQYDNPVRVVAFNTAEGWSQDVSEEVAREIMRRVGLIGGDAKARGFRRRAPRSRPSADAPAAF